MRCEVYFADIVDNNLAIEIESNIIQSLHMDTIPLALELISSSLVLLDYPLDSNIRILLAESGLILFCGNFLNVHRNKFGNSVVLNKNINIIESEVSKRLFISTLQLLGNIVYKCENNQVSFYRVYYIFNSLCSNNFAIIRMLFAKAEYLLLFSLLVELISSVPCRENGQYYVCAMLVRTMKEIMNLLKVYGLKV